MTSTITAEKGPRSSVSSPRSPPPVSSRMTRTLLDFSRRTWDPTPVDRSCPQRDSSRRRECELRLRGEKRRHPVCAAREDTNLADRSAVADMRMCSRSVRRRSYIFSKLPAQVTLAARHSDVTDSHARRRSQQRSSALRRRPGPVSKALQAVDTQSTPVSVQLRTRSELAEGPGIVTATRSSI